MRAAVGATSLARSTGSESAARGPELVLKHLNLVRRIANQMVRRMPSNVDAQDLIQTGMLGLLEAATRYECRRDASFATYAKRRIRGAMIDSLRRCDWGTRQLRRRLRDIDDARQRIEGRTGEAAKARAIADALKAPVKDASLEENNEGDL